MAFRKVWHFRIAAAVLGAVLLGGVMRGGISRAASMTDTAIVIKDFSFEPTTLNIAAGHTVTWTNRDDEPHNVTSDTGLFRSGGMDTDESFSFKFDKPGAYRFVCSIHPRMVGTIVVK
jgi:plastocyanin